MEKQLLKKTEGLVVREGSGESGFEGVAVSKRRFFCSRKLVAFALAGFIVAGVAQVAEARPGARLGNQAPGGGGAGVERQDLDQESIEARQQFFEQTQDLRRQMVVKRSLLKAQQNSAKPNSAEVERLAGGLFDLRQQMREQAKEAGIECTRKGARGAMGAGGRAQGKKRR